MKSLRVLIITTEAPDVAVGGLGFFHQMLWQHLKSMKVDFRTVYLNKNNTPPSRAADYSVDIENEFPLNLTPESRSLGLAWCTQQRIQPIIEAYKPDVISVHEAWTMLPCYFAKEKVQLTLHASFLGMQHPIARTQLGLQSYWEQKIASEASASLVLHSDWAVRTHHDYVTDTLPFPPFCFPIGVDRHTYPAKKIPHPEGKLVVSFFGRASDYAKNFPVFYRAISGLPAKYREQIDPRIYSHPPFPRQLLDEGYGGLRYVQGEEKMRAFSETDVVVMPSTHESFGIVGLESLLCNCELIAPRGLGMDSYLPATYEGTNTEEGIAKKLIALLENRADLRQKQDTNYYRKLVDKPEFDAATMTTRYIDIWRKMTT